MTPNSISTGAIRRSTVMGLLVALMLLVMLVRILLIQTVDFDRYQSKVLDQLTTESVIKADRGNIYDSNGVLLATNITTYRIFISPKGIVSFDKTNGLESGTTAQHIAQGLSDILGEDYGVTYDAVMAHTEHTRVLDRTIARNVDEQTTEKIRIFIDENKYNDQIYAEATSTRYYPQGTLAAHVLGFTSSDGTGLYGIELEYDEQLSGTSGKYITARDSSGNEMPYEYESYIPAQNGYHITSTINSYVQSVLEKQLEATLIESGANNRVCGIVMDVNTGAILAMATAPSFDLNDPWTLNEYSLNELNTSAFEEGSEEYSALKRELLLETWSNKAITEIYMPGSTFKILTVSMALEEKLVNFTEHFFCSGAFSVAGRTIHCHKVIGHGSLTLAGGLQQSCNPVMMTLGARIGTDKFYNYVKQFGYLEKTGIDLPGESGSIFYPKSSFSEIDLAVSSFGQNFKISAIQHITAISAVANGGYLVEPHVVSKITDDDGKIIYQHGTKTKRQVISEEICQAVSEILEEGVSGDGGAKNAYVPGYRVAAKTGTSEKIGDNKELRIGSCVAYAPADDPQVAVIIIVDEPSIGSLYGSSVAAPYVGNVMAEILPYLGVEAVYTDEELEQMAVDVPNFCYWSTALAKTYAENLDINVEIRGDGNYILKQSPVAGTSMEQSDGKIILYTTNEEVEKTYTVPNVVGRTAAAANSMIINSGFNIKIEGTRNYLSGAGAVVVSQTPAAGEVAAEGSVVTVTFRYVNEADDY
ncbi:MAG: PASTA domain-containing protein [Clostridia bacterium]|nr:PASTA domain-containing protein [Clostridia bacterium]